MDKFLCVNCVKLFKDSPELFVYNQYCTGFCALLHVMTVHGINAVADANPAEEIIEEKIAA